MVKDKSAKIDNPPLTLIQCCAEAVLTYQKMYDVKEYLPIVKQIYRKKGEGGGETLHSYSNATILFALHKFLDVLDYMIDNKYLSEDYR